MSLSVMVVNGTRYLIQNDSKAVDKTCKFILDSYPQDAIVEFDEVKQSDVTRKTVQDYVRRT